MIDDIFLCQYSCYVNYIMIYEVWLKYKRIEIPIQNNKYIKMQKKQHTMFNNIILSIVNQLWFNSYYKITPNETPYANSLALWLEGLVHLSL